MAVLGVRADAEVASARMELVRGEVGATGVALEGDDDGGHRLPPVPPEPPAPAAPAAAGGGPASADGEARAPLAAFSRRAT